MTHRLSAGRRVLFGLVLFFAAALIVVGPRAGEAAGSSTAPGDPGEKAVWTPADKDGFGTSTTTDSKVWYTLNNGELTEVYYRASARQA